MARLIVDTRERQVINWLTLARVSFDVEQLTVGDYAILNGDEITAIIERKTLTDYAASIIDGRHENRKKMLQLREETGCRVIYIIEGPAWPNENTLFGGIPYKSLRSSMFHLMMNDNIMIWTTPNEAGTVNMLQNFLKSYETLLGKKLREGDPSACKALLTKARPKTDEEILIKMWKCFGGIGPAKAKLLIRQHTLAGFIEANPPDKLTSQLLLSEVPGLTKNTAKILLANKSLSHFLNTDETSRAKIKIGNRNLGPVVSGRISKFFNLKIDDGDGGNS